MGLPKRKTSIIIDEELWRKWTHFVIDKRGTARKLSEELESALKEYMERHPPETWLEEKRGE